MNKIHYCLRIDLDNKQQQIVASQTFSLPLQQSLSTIRGGTIFTSAFSVHNQHGHHLFCAKEHYERLRYAYEQIYERSHLAFTYNEFLDYAQSIINHENGEEKQPCSLLIFLCGGNPHSIGYAKTRYSSGFGGDVKTLLFYKQPLNRKPTWAFEKGIHVLSFPHHRPWADVKLTSYIGGIHAQQELDALNMGAYLSLDHTHKNPEHQYPLALQQLITAYRLWDSQQQKAFRMLMLSKHKNLSSLKQLMPTLCANDLSCLDVYHTWCLEHPELLLHESVFVTCEQPPYLLEGSTFSIMGIDKDDAIHFIPIKGNGESKQGILPSVSVQCIENLAQHLGLTIKKAPIALSDSYNYKGLFALSSTRMEVNEHKASLLPIRSINGDYIELNLAQCPTYQAIIKHLARWARDYVPSRYEPMCSSKPYS